jgi:hypothetical protein
MTQFSEVTDQKHAPDKNPSQSGLAAAILLIRILLKNPTAPLRFRAMRPDEGRYVRPPRHYDIPAFREDMKYSSSNEQYLRPTLFCDPREPEVIAMAHELGAYEKTDFEFVESAFEFVRNNMFLEMRPLDSVSMTLGRGTGICYHLISVFVALCRAAGIKARYKVFRMVLREDQRNMVSDMDPLFMKMWEVTNLEAVGEAYVDSKWVDADVVASPLLQAVYGMPIARLGEDSIGTYIEAVPGTTLHLESIPSKIRIEWNAFKWFAPALMERMNVNMQRQYALGRKIIEEAGGIEAYDRKARRKSEEFSPIPELEYNKPIVFKE